MSDKMIVGAGSSANLPMPAEKVRVDFAAEYTAVEFQEMQQGYYDRKDHWFIFYDDGWLRFHWRETGVCILMLSFLKNGSGWSVKEVWANGASHHFDNATNKQYGLLVSALILSRLLESEKAEDTLALEMELGLLSPTFINDSTNGIHNNLTLPTTIA